MRSLLSEHLDDTKYCFVCGPANPYGLKLEPYIEGEKAVVASYITPDHLCSYRFRKDTGGFKAIVHGGILCALLDCVSAWIFFALRKKLVVTTEFKVKMLKPIFVGEKIQLRAEIISEKRDMVIVKGEIKNKGKLCTVSEIGYKILSEELVNKFTNMEE